MYKEKIGIIGGFGAYAALNLYKNILEVFKAEKEWDYPHIIMDNNFTMPSRTRALLYNESYGKIVEEIARSVRRMMDLEVEHIVLACGTAHYFLEDVYQQIPEAEKRIVNIVDVLGEELERERQQEALIVAAEGTLSKAFYERRLEKYGVCCTSPKKEHYGEIRYFIECVKKNEVVDETAERFLDFLKLFGMKNIILGCTEFPVLLEYVSAMETEGIRKKEYQSYRFFDPMQIVVEWLRDHMV